MKPSAYTVPMSGTLPLSASFDSVGPLAMSVEMCAKVYSVLSGSPSQFIDIAPTRLHVGVIKNYVLEQMDSAVAATYEAALKRLSKAGVVLHDVHMAVLDEISDLFVNGGLVAAEAYEWHRDLLEARSDEYDPRVSVRIKRGALSSAADCLRIKRKRSVFIERWTTQVEEFDAVIMPTVPIVAPMIAELDDEEAYTKANLLMLRNPTIVNAVDGCAISIPCHAGGEPPVGLMLACANGRDWQLLSMAKALRAVL
jgi:aspartyl-tRNA(Asn)/glutamyl-tRNA(Gln) amidotransferase subunit A